jgi:hypothetical protein
MEIGPCGGPGLLAQLHAELAQKVEPEPVQIRQQLMEELPVPVTTRWLRTVTLKIVQVSNFSKPSLLLELQLSFKTNYQNKCFGLFNKVGYFIYR